MFLQKIMLPAMLMFTLALAQENDSLITVRKSLLPSNILQQVETQQKIESYGKWVGLGKEVGSAVREGLGALTDETDRFSKTGVGKFTMFIIAFKVLGYPIIQLLFGSTIWLLGTVIAVIFFFTCFLPKKNLLSESKGDGKKWEYKEPLATKWSSGIGGSMAGLTAIYVLWCVFCCAIIFVH